MQFVHNKKRGRIKFFFYELNTQNNIRSRGLNAKLGRGKNGQ